MADYAETLFQAVDILLNKKIEQIKFDQTIKATVIDTSKADIGEYLVSTGEAKFTAYSTETKYRENETVMVTIPQGDYNNQKIIISKYVDNSNTPKVIQMPFDSIIDLTNNIITTKQNDTALWANSESFTYSIQENNTEIVKSFQGYGWSTTENDFRNSNVYQKSESLWQSWSKNSENFIPLEEPIQGYSILGLRANFVTWLAEFGTYQGNYGLAIELIFQTEPFTSAILTFDSSQFFGNVYAFDTKYSQEIVFDISEYLDYPIVGLRLFPYQRQNFQGTFDIEFPDESSVENFNSPQPNIYITDPYICFGMSSNNFSKDTAEIMTESLTYTKEGYFLEDEDKYFVSEDVSPVSGKSYYAKYTKVQHPKQEDLYKYFEYDNTNKLFFPTEDTTLLNKNYYIIKFRLLNSAPQIWQLEHGLVYEKEKDTNINERDNNNLKHIALRWVHKDESTNEIKVVENGAIPAHYEIRWYKSKLGASSPDQFAGAHWVRFYGISDEVDVNTGDWLRSEEEEDIATDEVVIDFQPNVNLQTEKIKVIIIKSQNNLETKVAESNILEFTNDVEVRNSTSLIDLNALSIKYEDELKGQYFIYQKNNQIKGDLEKEVRQLTAVFDPNEYIIDNKSELSDYTSIKWTFPDNNTMINPCNSDGSSIGRQVEFTDSIYVYYTINQKLNYNYSNNTVKLEVIKDGQRYEAEVLMQFGSAGTSGSDYTLTIEWFDDGDSGNSRGNAINLTENQNHILKGNIILKDQQGQIVDIPSDASLNANWYVAQWGGQEEKKKEVETKDYFYPVFSTTANAIINTNLNNKDYWDQGNSKDGNGNRIDNDYYYFIDNTENNNITYYIYDIDQKKFVTEKNSHVASYADINNDDYQLYRKCQEGESKNKLEFQLITNQKKSLFISPIDNETGDYISSYDVDNREPIIFYNNDAEYNKKYYYSKKKRYFVKINDQYILDPWTDYQEAENYYEPIEAKEVTYKGNNNYIMTSIVRKSENLNNVDFDQITLTGQELLNMNSIWVLQLTLSNFGDYDLVAIFPIALKNEDSNLQINGINDTGYIRYSSDGEVDYHKNSFKISASGVNDETFETGGYWRLLTFNDNHNITYSVVDVNDNNYGKIISIIDDNFLPELKNGNILSPPSIFIPQYRPYALQYIYNNKIYWTQPFAIYEENYPSATLNKWNGKDIVTDEQAGTISASGFSAGKKERDNTFTGVVIGDWSRSDTEAAIAKNTGIYGFNHGSMSYAFKDDGTGFIGKDGKGRIYLDGDKSQIFSSNWVNGNTPQGMLLDIDDGFIKMQSKNQFYSQISKNQFDAYWRIYDRYYNNGNGTVLYYSESENSSKIKLTPDSVYTSSVSHFYYMTQGGTDIKYITLGANQSVFPLSIGLTPTVSSRKFKVGWDGTTYITDGFFEGTITGSEVYTNYLDAQEGNIGGWTLGNNQLSGGSTILHSRNGITTNTLKLWMIDDNDNEINLGQIGYVEGLDGTSGSETNGFGIKSINNNKIFIDSTYSGSSDFGLAINSRSKGIWIQGGNDAKILIGPKNGNAPSGWSNSNNIRFEGTNSYLYTNIPAEHQFGIYARFA